MNKASALSNCDIRSKLTNCGKYGTISAWAFAFDFPQNHKIDEKEHVCWLDEYICSRLSDESVRGITA